MEVQFSPEIEAEIARRAASAGKAPSEVVQELVSNTLADEAKFLAAVQLGIDAADRGEFVEHEEVLARIEQRFR